MKDGNNFDRRSIDGLTYRTYLMSISKMSLLDMVCVKLAVLPTLVIFLQFIQSNYKLFLPLSYVELLISTVKLQDRYAQKKYPYSGFIC